MIKFCADCANYFPGTPSDCRAPENAGTDLISGQPIDYRFGAKRARCYMDACSKDAKWFKPLPDQVA